MLILSSLLAAITAQAATPPKANLVFCSSVAQVSAQVDECEANDIFLVKGEECLDKLDAESKRVAGMLPKDFSNNLDQKQKAKFGASNHDYKVTSVGLEQMIFTTQVAMGQIQDYKSALALPPDSDEPDVTQGNVEAYAMSVDCYGANKKNLDSLLEDFEKRLGQFQAAKKVTDAFASTTGSRQEDVKATITDSSRLNRAGRGDAGPKGPQKRDSDVSGIEEDKAKQKKLP